MSSIDAGIFKRVLSASSVARAEFRHVAELVRAGDMVLDVDCGEAGLARHLPHATYVGLDPYSQAMGTQPDIRNQTISQHAISHPEEYDVVCAFHAIEHVADPLGLARDLATCLRPGGRLCIVAPSRGSAITVARQSG